MISGVACQLSLPLGQAQRKRAPQLRKTTRAAVAECATFATHGGCGMPPRRRWERQHAKGVLGNRVAVEKLLDTSYWGSPFQDGTVAAGGFPRHARLLTGPAAPSALIVSAPCELPIHRRTIRQDKLEA